MVFGWRLVVRLWPLTSGLSCPVLRSRLGGNPLRSERRPEGRPERWRVLPAEWWRVLRPELRSGPPEPRVYPLVDFLANAFDQAFGHGIVITRTQVAVRAHRSADFRFVVAAHVRTVQPVADGHKCAQFLRA